jgi:hypothetical protein
MQRAFQNVRFWFLTTVICRFGFQTMDGQHSNEGTPGGPCQAFPLHTNFDPNNILTSDGAPLPKVSRVLFVKLFQQKYCTSGIERVVSQCQFRARSVTVADKPNTLHHTTPRQLQEQLFF